MTDLKDGESVEMQGSASRPYVLKNVAGVFSCSCAGWRFQSLPIERRTCRHLRTLRGDDAEEARVGSLIRSRAAPSKPVKAPPLLLAETWHPDSDPKGYLLSEKLDGVRAFWDGKQFLSRQGNRFHAPAWFTAGLPLEPLDGELWIDRKRFQRTVSIVRRQDESALWNEVRFLVFDAPADEGPFETRLKLIEMIMEINQPPFARMHAHVICSGHDLLQSELARVEALGGEGVMLRQPGSAYAAGRSHTLLKVKRFHDAEARVIGHEPGTGRHNGRLGALLVQMADGTRFEVGTGFTDAERNNPPPVNTMITFRYQELTDRGVPRFASYVGIRADEPTPTTPLTQGEPMPSASTKRRFEFVGGGSDKFWELSIDGNDVLVRFGRNGTNGQASTKTFADNAAAQQHADKLIREKLAKGYCEVP